MSVSRRVRQLIEPSLAGQGLEVVDVDLHGSVLRVTVDRPGGVDLDAISAATRAVSADLDRHDVVPGRYLLEVSSPGVERPLRTPEHFARAVGTTVTVRTTPATEGDRRLEGTLEEADDAGITVAGRRLAYDEVERARTVFAWGPQAAAGTSGRQSRGPAPKPGSRRKRSPSTATGAS